MWPARSSVTPLALIVIAVPGADDGFEQMMALADVFDATGAELRHRARLGTDIVADPDIEPSAALSPRTTHATTRGDRSSTCAVTSGSAADVAGVAVSRR